MFIVDDIAYGGEASPVIEVKSVRPMDGYKLWVRFTTNETKIFDFEPMLNSPCYLPLRDKAVFNRVYVDFGCAVWEEGDIDIATERLYSEGIPTQ